MATLYQQFESALEGWESQPSSTDSSQNLLSTVQRVLSQSSGEEIPPWLWHRYLNETRRSRFLTALPSMEARYEWAETVFPVLLLSNYTLETMLRQRVDEHPAKVLFQEPGARGSLDWSYQRVEQELRKIAAAFWRRNKEPRVAIISENSRAGAFCDLACLAFDILDTPLSPHFNAETFGWILGELRINLVVVEREEHRQRLAGLRNSSDLDFEVVLLDSELAPQNDWEVPLEQACAELRSEEIDGILANRPRRGLKDIATVMFTSGSTGNPKGVEFSSYNLISKRFARAAALPNVGDDEVLFCFLPLYHTFGRFLEMMGTLFWGGTYVFAANPSLETLLAGLSNVRPTGLISIPFRWQQIKERCLEEMGVLADKSFQEGAFRRVVGDRMRWGLSAAGNLDPEVFKFFQRHGVDLCSGFGMTEATGGITMTPPGQYRDNSVGVPLPGIQAELSPEGELLISGPYIASYLGDPDRAEQEDRWFSTGDVFRKLPDGKNFEIVGRIKDIYKNSKGQTIAPAAIEQKLAHVPGIERCFVVGDGRAYNVLLIAPAVNDPVVQGCPNSEECVEYFRQIITAVNKDLAPYERIVNFAVLERGFSVEQGELTPKGSFRRTAVEQNYSETINFLYRREYVEIPLNKRMVRIPRWFYRDLGILEDDIVEHPDGLLNRRARRILPVIGYGTSPTVLIGDLEYQVEGSVIDLGLFARQPTLWLANPSLIAFCPCKTGWDHSLDTVASQVFIPWRKEGEYSPAMTVTPASIRDALVNEANHLCTVALFGSSSDSLKAVEKLREVLPKASMQLCTVIRRRLESLARHPSLKVRCAAYQTILLDKAAPDFSRILPSFLLSGLPFLSEESIVAIAAANIERDRLDALRKRLRRYRTQLDWPVSPVMRKQFDDIFTLLETFVIHRPAFYSPVRSELVNWVLHEADPELARCAQGHLNRMVDRYEVELEKAGASEQKELWAGKIVFQDRLSPEETELLERALIGTSFLKQSAMLAFDGTGVEISEIPSNGIWISRVYSFQYQRLYRVSVNTISGKHFDLLVAICNDMDSAAVLRMCYWMIVLNGYIDGSPVVRQFGCYRPDLMALSMALVSDLTVWERIRELAGGSLVESRSSGRHWRNLLVRGLTAFFTGWLHSDRRIVPGPVTPANVVVPVNDFRSDVKILSIIDWQPYAGPWSLIQPMLKNFFLQTVSNYPSSRKHLKLEWIFDACVEALGVNEARAFLEQLRREPANETDASGLEQELLSGLEEYIARVETTYPVPLFLQCAIERFQEWNQSNPEATFEAKELQINELHRLYRLERYQDLGRYYLYRHTYFSDASPESIEAFEQLLKAMFQRPDVRPTHMLELSELQKTLLSKNDRLVFTRIVFPMASASEPVDIVAIGSQEQPQVVVTSKLGESGGAEFTVREPIQPAEIGRLYRLFLDTGMTMSLAEQERYLVVLDSEQQVVGGLCYKLLEPTVAYLDGIAVSSFFEGESLREGILMDFCTRMTGLGVRVINTRFALREFYLGHGFQVDKRWAGLVRFLPSQGLDGSQPGNGNFPS